ncbi:MAG: hypothetical protein SGJ18_11455 [Pseudomonadota bacterium]|nr:hypothetical protein [Pseudomonadota bacterium]
MKRNFLVLLSFSGILLAASVSQAVYIDPYFGFLVASTVSTEVPSTPSTSEGDISGSGIGLRLGWSFVGLAVGVDYQMTSTTEKQTAGSAVGQETKSKVTNLGIFADYELPILPLRVYGAYILDSTIDPETAGSADTKGSGIKIGAGFTGLPFVAINLDYSTLKYDESSPASAVAFESNAKIVMLSVSLPLNL